jgi:hypothetical protein
VGSTALSIVETGSIRAGVRGASVTWPEVVETGVIRIDAVGADVVGTGSDRCRCTGTDIKGTCAASSSGVRGLFYSEYMPIQPVVPKSGVLARLRLFRCGTVGFGPWYSRIGQYPCRKPIDFEP